LIQKQHKIIGIGFEMYGPPASLFVKLAATTDYRTGTLRASADA